MNAYQFKEKLQLLIDSLPELERDITILCEDTLQDEKITFVDIQEPDGMYIAWVKPTLGGYVTCAPKEGVKMAILISV